MLTLDEAKEIALQQIRPDWSLIEESIIEKPYGWFFSFQSKKWLQTHKTEDALFGSKGFVVEKENGRVFWFGSGYSLEQDFEQYEKGFKFERYNLTVKEIKKRAETVKLLHSLHMVYATSLWKPDRTQHLEIYTKKQLRRLLKNLPCRFINQGFYFRVDVLEEIDRAGCCSYHLKGLEGDISANPPPGAIASAAPVQRWWQFWR